VEFIVEGSPTSHQTKNKKALHAWKLRVRSEAGKVWSNRSSRIRLVGAAAGGL